MTWWQSGILFFVLSFITSTWSYNKGYKRGYSDGYVTSRWMVVMAGLHKAVAELPEEE